MWYRYRRPWRGRSFIWLMFFPMLFFFGHGGFGFLAWLFLIMAIGFIIRAAVSTWSNPQSTYQQPYQPYQPYQQQTDYYYRPTNTYSEYQQGYEAQRTSGRQEQDVREAAPQQATAQEESYEQYEQPQAQYPQEMPPMQ